MAAATMQSVTLRVGDLVMFTENNHELGLRNGSLGKIVAALEVRNALSECCIVEWDDGRRIPLISSHVYALTHAYGLTIHKAQGSQFNRVIIPIRQSRLLDQSLVYTAATRGGKSSGLRRGYGGNHHSDPAVIQWEQETRGITPVATTF